MKSLAERRAMYPLWLAMICVMLCFIAFQVGHYPQIPVSSIPTQQRMINRGLFSVPNDLWSVPLLQAGYPSSLVVKGFRGRFVNRSFSELALSLPFPNLNRPFSLPFPYRSVYDRSKTDCFRTNIKHLRSMIDTCRGNRG